MVGEWVEAKWMEDFLALRCAMQILEGEECRKPSLYAIHSFSSVSSLICELACLPARLPLPVLLSLSPYSRQANCFEFFELAFELATTEIKCEHCPVSTQPTIRCGASRPIKNLIFSIACYANPIQNHCKTRTFPSLF